MPELRQQPHESGSGQTSNKDMIRRYFDEGRKALPPIDDSVFKGLNTEEIQERAIKGIADVLEKVKEKPSAISGDRSQSKAEIGDSLLREKRRELDRILPAPSGGEYLQVFPHIGDLPADNLPAVPHDLIYRSDIEKLVSNPRIWKGRVDTCKQDVQRVAALLQVEGDLPVQCIQGGLGEISHYLNFLVQGEDAVAFARNRYVSMDSSLATLRYGVNGSENNEVKRIANDFLNSLA